jgi:uncharacterized Zn finger protein
MKKFLKTCYVCGNDVKEAKVIKEGVRLSCMRCPKCGEEYFTSSELIKFDIKTGRRTLVRRFGTVGDSVVVRFPTKIIQNYKIEPGDYGLFEERPEGILIRPVRAKEME